MESVDCLVIGAGVVGLAVARHLALIGREVVIVDSASTFGSATSSRNSEVIHAGIYYPTGSLKARTCVAGKAMVYRYAAERAIAHRRCGKLIVATSVEQRGALEALRRQARANGVDDLRPLSAEEARAMEPQLRCVAALHSPSTGIIDSHALMLSFLGEAEDHGASLALNAPVIGGRVTSDGIVIEVGGASPITLLARSVINAAGLGAQGAARAITGIDPASVPPLHYAKGNYFALGGRAPFSRLVYPVPEPGGLGVHITLDLAGQGRFGPDVEWIERLEYDVDRTRADAFYAEIRKYWPGLPDGALLPAYAGIRPKLGPRGSPAADFVVQGGTAHGVAGLVQLFGIESPGLTASMAIAEHVASLLAD
jgi:L-2-hydroxyglutarate oxidase LhgO